MILHEVNDYILFEDIVGNTGWGGSRRLTWNLLIGEGEQSCLVCIVTRRYKLILPLWVS